jgi:hypothetical protein
MRPHDLRDCIKKLRDHLDALWDAQYLIKKSFGEGLKLFIGEALIELMRRQPLNIKSNLSMRREMTWTRRRPSSKRSRERSKI